MRVVISGYYGFGNLGDEAVLAAMLPALRARMPTAEFTVLSANPPHTARLHGVGTAPRIGLGALRALSSADLFLSGGGSLIQDATSARSAFYYLGTLGLATAGARRTMVFAQGVGPLRRAWVRTLTRRVFDRVDLLTVRDQASADLLHALRVRRLVQVVADPVFALEPASTERAEVLLGNLPRPRIGVALRSWGHDAVLDPVITVLRAWRDRTKAVVVPLAFHPARDLEISRRVAAALGGQVLADVAPRDMLAVIGELDLLVGMRLHALIMAAVTGVAMVGLSYDPKVDAFFRQLPISQVLSINGLDAPQLRDALALAWERRAELRAALRHRTAGLRADALRAADLAATLAAASVGGPPAG